MARHTKSALESAMSAVDKTIASVEQVLAELNDENRRAAIKAEVQQEVAENPGWLDEIGKLMHNSPVSPDIDKSNSDH